MNACRGGMVTLVVFKKAPGDVLFNDSEIKGVLIDRYSRILE